MNQPDVRPDPAWSEPARGVARLADPRVWGTFVGAAGGSVFVMANRGDLTTPWPTVAVIGWAAELAAYAWFVLVVPRRFGPVREVRPVAGFVYLGSVLGMVAAIRIGSALLENADRTRLQPALIVVAVGLHFLPFAVAFHTPLFTRLGSVMVTIGSIGLASGWLWREGAASWAAVLAGLVMIAMIAGDAAVTREGRRGEASARSGTSVGK